MGGRDHSIECEHCGHYRGGLNDLKCDCDQHDLFGAWELQERLSTLAHNLAIAGGLCAAFEQGRAFVFRAMFGLPAAEDWKPGCQRSAP